MPRSVRKLVPQWIAIGENLVWTTKKSVTPTNRPGPTFLLERSLSECYAYVIGFYIVLFSLNNLKKCSHFCILMKTSSWKDPFLDDLLMFNYVIKFTHCSHTCHITWETYILKKYSYHILMKGKNFIIVFNENFFMERSFSWFLIM